MFVIKKLYKFRTRKKEKKKKKVLIASNSLILKQFIIPNVILIKFKIA